MRFVLAQPVCRFGSLLFGPIGLSHFNLLSPLLLLLLILAMSSSAVSACVTCDSYSCTQVHDVNGMVKSSALGLLDNTDIPGKLVNCLKFGPNSGKTIAIKNVIEHLAAREGCSDRIAIRFRDLNTLSTFRSFFPSCENDVVRHPNGLHVRFATRIDINAVDSYHLVIHDDTSPELDGFKTKSNELYVYTPVSHSTSLSNVSKRKHEDTEDDDTKKDVLLSSAWHVGTKYGDGRYVNEYYSDRIRAEHALCTWILEDLELNEWSPEDVLDVGRYFEFGAFKGSSMRVIKKYRNDVKVMQEIAHELLPDEKYQIDKITIQGVKRQRQSAKEIKVWIVQTLYKIYIFWDKKQAQDAACVIVCDDINNSYWYPSRIGPAMLQYFESSGDVYFDETLMKLRVEYKMNWEVLAKIMHHFKSLIHTVSIIESTRPAEHTDHTDEDGDKMKIRQQLESRLDELENKAIQLKSEIAELRTIKDKQILDKYDIEHE